MVIRPLYLKHIEPFIGKPVIKVITGIRRCGKSELLKMIREELKNNGIDEDHILFMNFESMQWSAFLDAKSLYEYVSAQCSKSGKYYLFFDEIQEVDSWEKAVNSLMADRDVDIYLTGSNSKLLSSELATYLAGRYVETTVYPLSYREYLDFHNTSSSQSLFERYLRQGGFPALHITDYTDEQAYQMVKDIYASVLLRDTVQRHKIRNIDMLERLVRFMFGNIGNLFSAKSVSQYLKNQQRSMDAETLYSYLSALESSFILTRCPRFDLKGKEVLSTNEKFYIADLALVYSLGGYAPNLIAGLMENLVCLELKRQGFKVYVGKIGTLEIDFVAVRQEQTLYVQVCFDISDGDTLKRELTSLAAIRDNYPKMVVVGNSLQAGNIDGIKILPIAQFLSQDY